MSYLTPTSLEAALSVLDAPSFADNSEAAVTKISAAKIVAGGTDFYPSIGDRPIKGPILDITRIAALSGIHETDFGWQIGAATRWTELVQTPLPPCFDGLKAAALEIGSIQIQNSGTLVGNLCNASPAADSVPPLLTLEAQLVLQSTKGKRLIRLEDFITGPRQTLLQPNELVTAIHIPRFSESSHSAFLKLGIRHYMVISICMVSVLLTPDNTGGLSDARIAVGACSPVACRLPSLETKLVGQSVVGDTLANLVQPDDLDILTPIDDIRSSAHYRREAALTLLRRALVIAAGTLPPMETDHG